MKAEKRAEPDYAIKLLATSLSLGLLLILARAQVISFAYLPSILARAGGLALAAYSDCLYVAVMTIAFLGLLRMTRRSERARRALYRLFLGIALFSVLVAWINVKVVPMLGKPMNYQWLYYSDFLQSQDARNAILAEFSWKLLLIGAAGVAGLLTMARVFSEALKSLLRRFGSRRLTLVALVALVLYFPISSVIVARRDWPASKLENPVLSFARSVVVAEQSPGLLTMRTSVGPEDFEPSNPSSPIPSAIAQRSPGQIRNVVLVVLESVPAQYLDAYGGAYSVTPEVDKYGAQSAVFTNIYAHCPATSSSLVSLLMSIYPRISYHTLAEEQPAVRFPSLSSDLKSHGYRTAFLSSADLRYQHCDVFLSHREFDTIEDYRSLRCDKPILHASTKNWPFLDGRDDICTADALIDWIQSDSRQPYFAVLWTMMTHHPYFATDGEPDFGVAETFDRYLKALHHDDRVLGHLLHALEERRLDRSTLVVVVGDHGEAFGQHGQWGHARYIYEENVHVPLILINPDLFHGERSPVIGGLIDLAPTVLDVLGFALPAGWQGRSLFSANRSRRVYFFAPWSDHLFGLREDTFKVIYDADDNHFEVYDLSADPHETVNHAPQRSQEIALWQQRLAAWVQYQSKMTRGLGLALAR